MLHILLKRPHRLGKMIADTLSCYAHNTGNLFVAQSVIILQAYGLSLPARQRPYGFFYLFTLKRKKFILQRLCTLSGRSNAAHNS